MEFNNPDTYNFCIELFLEFYLFYKKKNEDGVISFVTSSFFIEPIKNKIDKKKKCYMVYFLCFLRT